MSVTRSARRWATPGLVLLVAVAVLVLPGGTVGAVMAVLLFVYAWSVSPAFFPRGTKLDAALVRARAGDAPLVLWKPGCAYCIRLRLALGGSARRVSWVDSSLDGHANALVRSHNGGDHTTPTVVHRDEVRTNPDVAWVRSVLGG